MRNMSNWGETAMDDRLRADILVTMLDSCAVVRKTSVPTLSGGAVETWAIVEGFETITCGVSEDSAGNESITADQIMSGETFILHMDPSAFSVEGSLLESDRIRYKAHDYEIVGITNPVSVNIAWRVQLKFVK